MSTIREQHRKAMSLLDESNVARMSGDTHQSFVLLRQAFETERGAAERLADALDKEPTRSILLRSAATLALDCGEYGEAERLTATGLMGNPPEAVAEELREVQTKAISLRNSLPVASTRSA